MSVSLLNEAYINQTYVRLGNKIECVYNGKPRIGFVESIRLGGPMLVKTNEGHRSFTRSKITKLRII